MRPAKPAMLTQEEADGIESAIAQSGGFDAAFCRHDDHPTWWTEEAERITDMPLHKFARALYAGYKVYEHELIT